MGGKPHGRMDKNVLEKVFEKEIEKNMSEKVVVIHNGVRNEAISLRNYTIFELVKLLFLSFLNL